MENLWPISRHQRVRKVGIVASLVAIQGLALSFALPLVVPLGVSIVFAAPPNGRMNSDERHRLRQEVRQHSGGYQRPPGPAAPGGSPGQGHTGQGHAGQGNSGQGNSGQAATGQGIVVPQVSPGSAVGQVPGGVGPSAMVPNGVQTSPQGVAQGVGRGRLSEDDRRALRQQLREQRAQREAFNGAPLSEGPTR
jgi:hypothetical protein